MTDFNFPAYRLLPTAYGNYFRCQTQMAEINPTDYRLPPTETISDPDSDSDFNFPANCLPPTVYRQPPTANCFLEQINASYKYGAFINLF